MLLPLKYTKDITALLTVVPAQYAYEYLSVFLLEKVHANISLAGENPMIMWIGVEEPATPTTF